MASSGVFPFRSGLPVLYSRTSASGGQPPLHRFAQSPPPLLSAVVLRYPLSRPRPAPVDTYSAFRRRTNAADRTQRAQGAHVIVGQGVMFSGETIPLAGGTAYVEKRQHHAHENPTSVQGFPPKARGGAGPRPE